MANRLSKIYTRTGDAGSTGLGDGSRVAKDSLRIIAMGDVDELNSVIGLLLTELLSAKIRDCLTRIQHDLFSRSRCRHVVFVRKSMNWSCPKWLRLKISRL